MSKTKTFRVVQGCHTEGGKLYRANSDNNIVESKTDLNKHNYPNSYKFEELTDDQVAALNNPASSAVAQEPESDSGFDLEELQGMSEDQLREFAEGFEIDLGKASTKTALIKKIMESAQ